MNPHPGSPTATVALEEPVVGLRPTFSVQAEPLVDGIPEVSVFFWGIQDGGILMEHVAHLSMAFAGSRLQPTGG